MASLNFYYFLQAPSPDTVTLGAGASTECRRDTLQSLAQLLFWSEIFCCICLLRKGVLVVLFTATTLSNCHGRVPAVTTADSSSCVVDALCTELEEARSEKGMDVRVTSETTLPLFGDVLCGDDSRWYIWGCDVPIQLEAEDIPMTFT